MAGFAESIAGSEQSGDPSAPHWTLLTFAVMVIAERMHRRRLLSLMPT